MAKIITFIAKKMDLVFILYVLITNALFAIVMCEYRAYFTA